MVLRREFGDERRGDGVVGATNTPMKKRYITRCMGVASVMLKAENNAMAMMSKTNIFLRPMMSVR